MPLTNGATFAGFTIERRLGSGGMGEVYLARHPRLPRYDAIKLLPPEWSDDEDYRARFSREADLASTLWHPHIVGVHDRGEHDGQLWISMDFVDGMDVAQILAHQPNALPVETVVNIVTAVGSALDYAHGRGLLHRDVKPANIMVTSDHDERVLLTDFGIARDVDDAGGLTKTNTAVGTVAYAAPEQLMGSTLDGRTDQYALAATAYHLLTGSQPFPHANPAVVIGCHLNSPPPLISALRPEYAGLDRVFAAALAKNPRDRYPRCADFARALADNASGGVPALPSVPPRPAPIGQPHPNAPYPIPPRKALNPWTIVAVAVTVMVMLGVVAMLWQPWRGDERTSQAADATRATRTAESAPGSLPDRPPVTLPDRPPEDSGCGGTVTDYRDIDHPSLGPMRIFLLEGSTGAAGSARCVSAVTAENRALPPITVDSSMYTFGFADPATDSTRNTFIEYNPGRYDGVLVLVPDAQGFEDIGWEDGVTYYGKRAFYYAELVGPDGNGEYVIRQSSNDCEPDCAGGTVTSVDLHWNGTDYVR